MRVRARERARVGSERTMGGDVWDGFAPKMDRAGGSNRRILVRWSLKSEKPVFVPCYV